MDRLYLIPVNANIQSENFLRQKTVSVQAVLGELNDAGNALNIVALRINPNHPYAKTSLENARRARGH